MKKSIITSLFINLNVLFLFGAYEVGDTISIDDQNIEYDICSGDYDSNQLKLADFNGDLNGAVYMVTLLLIQATWWEACVSTIGQMDYVIEYWENNPHVRHVTALDDLGQPYSCEQWNNLSSTPYLIIDDGFNNDLYMMFHNQDSYPTHALIDHNMIVYYKGNGLSSWVINQNIQEMLDNCGELCSGNASAADINFDGYIDILDIIELANIIINDDSNEFGDVNNDGIINILDIITIVNIILNTWNIFL